MPALVERPKLTKMMYKVLQQHIMGERERKKQEQEQDEMMERLKKERELKKKKEEKDNLTLEQTKEQIQKLEQKLKSLSDDKHVLFLKLKKILNQEEETRKRAQIKEQGEMSLQQSYTTPVPPGHGLQVGGHAVMLQQAVRPQMYKPTHIMHQVKRQRSPSPTPSHSSASYQTYGGHSEAKYAHTTYQQTGKQPASLPTLYQHPQPDYVKRPQGGNYPQSQTSHVIYTNQPGASYQQGVTYSSSQSQPGKYPAGQSAFTSYPSHYSQHQQKVIGEAYSQGYSIQRAQQPAYITTNLQQLEQHQKQSGFNEQEKFKLQQSAIRGIAPLSGQSPALIQQLQLQQQQQAAQAQAQAQAQAAQQAQAQAAQQAQQQPKGSIVTGYPARTQGTAPVVTTYQQSSGSQSNFSNPQQGNRNTYNPQYRNYQ
ncbi:hypothetical protein LOTGIDRAFT_239575 [Lottia gigantea]|uniref:G protein pathway suppressor 2 n=1 Tax=Lottia gigantea TaxID=225164 RepID=V4A6Z7_LOTGI|nr:hypothetical protein LOTGIDRAFT_239575 [Lottia gigantea]ESO92492.1 hypothetical protein LOTGIDRAFT_239575 [Lottia gigantea]